MNCSHKTNDVVASSNSDVTRKAVCETAVLSVEGINRLVARKRFLPTEHSALSLIDNFRKRWMACKGLVSLIIIRLILILGMLGRLTKIIRCERKSVVGNSMEFGSNEKLRNVGAPFPFNIFRKWLNTVLGFQRKLWHCGMIYLLWKRNKLGTKERKKNYGVSVVGLFTLKRSYVTYDLATFSKKRLAYDLATLWKHLWLGNVLGFVYAYSRTYVLPVIASYVYLR